MDSKQDKWIKDILDSVNDIQRTDPNPFLFAKIRDRLHSAPQPVYLSPRTVWLSVASFTLLTLLNVQLSTQWSAATNKETSTLNTVISDMQLYPATTQFYDAWSEQNY
ncbi:hypothetical protein [Spirosoma fluviale]|uniref:Uncharacterized protein n=1 Tax=Spirosoma fluviale TaxID=1597977 RepID=A0A286FXY8_9BACT|nr:hypothetical protein [Spirosoma fluviale]SOD88062.1 hypothetical protein SAMN06269250_2479 [Spirosoma fluviale]